MRLLIKVPNEIELLSCLGSSIIVLVSIITAFISKSQAMGVGIYNNIYGRTTAWKETRPYYYDTPPWERRDRESLPPPEPQPFVDILDIPPPLRLVPQGPSLFDLLKILPPLEDLLARRIAFSVNKPNFTPDIPPRWRRQDKPDPYAIFKRQIPDLMVRACPEHHEWAQIRSGINLDNTEVQVTERQWFWRTTCVNNTMSCFGFKSDDGLRSECRQTNSWMIAWAKPSTDSDYRWQHIAVPTGCSCAVPMMSVF